MKSAKNAICSVLVVAVALLPVDSVSAEMIAMDRSIASDSEHADREALLRFREALDKRAAFLRGHACPTGDSQFDCLGYVVGIIKPLCAGGRDQPSNMQWLTIQEAMEKAKQEREICRAVPASIPSSPFPR